MKILSVAIPSYNSQDYMSKCIESLLPGGEDVEILVVDDGSKDDTARIADEYEAKYPGIVRAIHQENAGHGGAVNTGIANATGFYFKVVDSDDWVDPEAYEKVLETLKGFVRDELFVDMLLCNYVYEKEGAKNKKVIDYVSALPQNQVMGWEDANRFHMGQYILMHSVIYRTELLKNSGMKLPEHTFYVDNLYVFEPLPYVETMYYLNVDFYRYYIGRSDQSVNEKIMIKRIDQQLKVNHIMIDYMANRDITNVKLKNYMYNYLEIITAISSIFLIASGSRDSIRKKKELWRYMKKKDAKLYYKLRHRFLGVTLNMPGYGGRSFALMIYKIAHRIFGFN